MEDNYVAVILEEMRSNFKVFGEGLLSTNEKLDKLAVDVDQIKEKLAENTFLLSYTREEQEGMKVEVKGMREEQQEMKKEQQEMKKEQQEMKKEQQEMKKDIKETKQDIKEIKTDIKKIDKRLSRIEDTVTVHEQKLKVVGA